MFEAYFYLTLSSKNKQILVTSGHEYYLKRKNKNTTNWNCSKYQTHKCQETATTEGENFIQTRGEHNQDISKGKTDARLVFKNIKDLSKSNTPTVAYATTIQPIRDDLATEVALPTKKNLFRIAQGMRKQREQVLPVSTATGNFEIAKLFENFVRFDSRQYEHEKINCSGDREVLSVLENSKFCLADGSFKVTHEIFYQLYSIYVSLSGDAPACIYPFLPNKTYYRFLEAPKKINP